MDRKSYESLNESRAIRLTGLYLLLLNKATHSGASVRRKQLL